MNSRDEALLMALSDKDGNVRIGETTIKASVLRKDFDDAVAYQKRVVARKEELYRIYGDAT